MRVKARAIPRLSVADQALWVLAFTGPCATRELLLQLGDACHPRYLHEAMRAVPVEAFSKTGERNAVWEITSHGQDYLRHRLRTVAEACRKSARWVPPGDARVRLRRKAMELDAMADQVPVGALSPQRIP